jgi:hypothetical protein
MEESLRCGRCGKKFYSKYNSGGSIEHENYTSNHNLECDYFRGEFIESLNLATGNYCNVKDISTETMKDIQKCMLIWLKKRDDNLYEKAVAFLAERENRLYSLISGCSEEDKRHFCFYYARANRLIEFLGKYSTVKIEKIKTVRGNNSYAYIANTEEGLVLLDLDKD